MLDDADAKPWITYAAILSCVLVTLYEKYCGIPLEAYGCSYNNVVIHGELWRVVVASFSHQDVWHLALNMFMLWQCRVLETICGSFAYLRMHVVVILLSTTCTLIVDRWALMVLRNSSFVNSIRDRYIVGYSPVVFGCVVVLTQEWTVGERIVRGLVSDSMYYWNDVAQRKGLDIFEALSGIPLVAIICALVLLDHTSYVAHGAGLVLGTLVWGGVFDWMTKYWFSCAAMWVFALAVVSCFHNAGRRREQEEIGVGGDSVEGGALSWSSRLFRGHVQLRNEPIRLFHVHYRDREAKRKARVEVYDQITLLSDREGHSSHDPASAGGGLLFR